MGKKRKYMNWEPKDFSRSMLGWVCFVCLSGWVCAAFVPLSKRPENWGDVMWGRQTNSTQCNRQPKFNQRGWPNTAFFCLKNSSLARFSNRGLFRWKKTRFFPLQYQHRFFCSFHVFFEFSFRQNSASFFPCIFLPFVLPSLYLASFVKS